MTLKGWLWGCLAACAVLSSACWGQPASPWRGYKMADGLTEPACSSVTVSAQGTVLARHLNAPSLTRLDGYTVNVLPAPPTRDGRCYESPAGQLWASSPEGLHEFKDGAWVLHPVAEIAAESKSLGPSHHVPLFVVRQGRVLFLLRDRLAALDAGDPQHVQVETMRMAGQTRLGEFLGLTSARDGGLWISGKEGCAKLPSPIRNLKPDTEWQEFILPDTLAAQALREPREDESGALTAVAESRDEVRRSVVVRFDGQSWTSASAGTERIQFAWQSPGPTFWATAPTALFARFNPAGSFDTDDSISARRFLDMATEPSGAFWLATSDGLFRHSPLVWQTPAPLQSLRNPVYGLAEDAEGRLWFLSGGELHSLRAEDHQVHAWPETARRAGSATRALVALANGTLLLATEDQLFRFRPNPAGFDQIAPENDGQQIRFLGISDDGSVCVQMLNSAGRDADYRLATHNGSAFKAFSLGPSVPSLGHTLLALYQARNGDLWLSGELGVACRRANQWKTFLAASQTAPEAASLFAEAADGRLWCATRDRLWSFDGRDWSPVRAVFDHINDLVCRRDDSLWIASNSGLHRLTAAGWLENSTEEGLPSPTIRCLREDRRGRLWVGTGQGLSQHQPQADLDAPRTEILTPADARISEGDSLVISFSGVDKWKFTPRRRLLYSYRLDDLDWSPLQEFDTVTLADLPAGKHTFSVRAVDRSGNVDSKPAQLAFLVTLPWFKETRLLLIASGGVGVALFFAALAFNRHLRLRRSYADVEQKVAERTRELELASRELLQSQKMNALGTLAAGIAHDFNNILSIVKGSAQIIEDNLDNPKKIQTRLDRIKTVVEQGAGIVQAMLGFSRSSEGVAEPCDVNAVVDSTITLLGDRFLRDVEVRVEAAPGLPRVPAAKDLVQQVLLNLIFNAAESMQEQKNVLLGTALRDALPADLFLRPTEAPSYVAIFVRDSGCGIPQENLPRIFEPFFTTKALSARRGTGLGLSMVYELAKRMNAGLGVESAVGLGSTFTLFLPVPLGIP